MSSILFIALTVYQFFLIVSLFIVYIARTISIAHFTTLSEIPNAHWSAPYSSLWLLSLKFRGLEHRTRYACHRELGDVIRLAPRELSVNCIDRGVKTVYNSYWDKGTWFYRLTNYGYKYLFSMIEDKAHKERKSMLHHAFSSNSQILESPELDHILKTLLFERFLPQIKIWEDTGEAINVLRETKAFSMDVTSAFSFGLENGTDFIRDQDEKGIIEAFEVSDRRLFWITQMPITFFIMRLLGINLMKKEHTEMLTQFEKNVLWECKAAKESMAFKDNSEPEHKTVYARFRHALEANPRIHELDIDMIIAAEMWNHLQAGHEGPGITLAFIMAELSRNPVAVNQLVKELLELRKETNGNWPSGKQINKLEYLDAIVWETMRLYPTALGPFPRVVPSTLKTEAGSSYFCPSTRLGNFDDIPAGTNVSASPYSLHRNPDIFVNPEIWNPERWLDDEVPRKLLEKWWWAFGSGSRICIGNHLSFRMMKAFIVAVYGDFDPYLISSDMPKQVDGLLGGPVGNEVLMKFAPSWPKTPLE